MLDPRNLPQFPPAGTDTRSNEPRVRELIRRVVALRENAARCLEGEGGVLDPVATLAALEEIEFGLGGLLPAIGVKFGILPDGTIGKVVLEREGA